MRQQIKVVPGKKRSGRLQEVALFSKEGDELELTSKRRITIAYDDERYYAHAGVLVARLDVGDAIGRYRVWRPEQWVAAEGYGNIEMHLFVRGSDPWADNILGFAGANSADAPSELGLIGASDDTGLDLLVYEEPIDIAFVVMSGGNFVDDPEARPTAGSTIFELELLRV